MRRLVAVTLLLAITIAHVRSDLAQMGDQQASFTLYSQADTAEEAEEPPGRARHAKTEAVGRAENPPHVQEDAVEETGVEEKPVQTHRKEAASHAEKKPSHREHSQTEATDAEVPKAPVRGHRTHTESTEHAEKKKQAHAPQQQHNKAEAGEEAKSHAEKPTKARAPHTQVSDATVHGVKTGNSHHEQAEMQQGRRSGKSSSRGTSNHSKAEATYWDARENAQALRNSLAPESLASKDAVITNGLQVWDLYGPDYNCPLLKERIGGCALSQWRCSGARHCVSVLHQGCAQLRSAQAIRNSMRWMCSPLRRCHLCTDTT